MRCARRAIASSPAAAIPVTERTADGDPSHDGPSPVRLDVAGDTPLHELADRLDLPERSASAGVVTVGGLVVARLGRVPTPGEEVTTENLRLRVLASDGRVVQRVEVERTTPPDTPASAEDAA